MWKPQGKAMLWLTRFDYTLGLVSCKAFFLVGRECLAGCAPCWLAPMNQQGEVVRTRNCQVVGVINFKAKRIGFLPWKENFCPLNHSWRNQIVIPPATWAGENKVLRQASVGRDILQQKVNALCVRIENDIRKKPCRLHPCVEITLIVIIPADMHTQSATTNQARLFYTSDN